MSAIREFVITALNNPLVLIRRIWNLGGDLVLAIVMFAMLVASIKTAFTWAVSIITGR